MSICSSITIRWTYFSSFLDIVDTPGTDSIEQMEEEITREFVPRADVEQVEHQALQPVRIGVDDNPCFNQFGPQGDALGLRDRLELIDDHARQLAEVDRPEARADLARFRAREREELVNQPFQLVQFFELARERRLASSVPRRLPHRQLDVSAQRRERRAQLVSQRGAELAHLPTACWSRASAPLNAAATTSSSSRAPRIGRRGRRSPISIERADVGQPDQGPESDAGHPSAHHERDNQSSRDAHQAGG